MGTTFTNIQVFTPPEEGKNKLEIVIDAVRQWVSKDGFEEVGADEEVEPEQLRRIIISPPGPEPWTGIYDEFEDEYLDTLREYALFISKATGFPTVSNLAFDSDVIEMGLFKSGEEIDFYSSDPSYGEGEDLSRAEKLKLKGTPELWQEFLIPGKTSAHLRKAWNKRPIFAEEIQQVVVRLFGMSNYATGGFAFFEYLEEISEPVALTLLRFRAKGAKSFQLIRVEGLPVFDGFPYRRKADFFVKAPISLQASFRNFGGPGKGLRLAFWGSAFDLGLLEPERVQLIAPDTDKSDKSQIVREYQLRRYQVAEIVAGYEVILPDFEWQGALIPDKEAKVRASIMVSRSYEVQLAQSMTVIFYGKALKEGQGEFHFAFVSTDNPVECHASAFTKIEVKTRSEIVVERPSTFNPQLLKVAKALEGAHRLYALITFGPLTKNNTVAVRQSIEKWHQITNPPQNSTYELVSQSKITSKHKALNLAPDQIPQSVSWQKFIQSLKNSESLSGYQVITEENQTRHWRIENKTSGFAFNRNTNPLVRQNNLQNPPMVSTLAFWINLDNYSGETASEVKHKMVELIDTLAAQTPVLQAFIANWDWPQTPESFSATTLYEAMLHLNGGVANLLQSYNTQFLRAVTREMWFGPELLVKLGDKRTQLDIIADIEQIGEGLKIALKRNTKIEQLTQIITPILPDFNKYRAAEEEYNSFVQN